MKTILLAEHHAPTREHVHAELGQAGYVVKVAGDPGTAMELFISERPDAVVVAVEFPRLDGAHVGAIIRASDEGARVPIIAVDKAHLGKARGVGAVLDLRANAYIANPLKRNELVNKLASLRELSESAKSKSGSGVQAIMARSPVAAGELRGLPLPALLHSFYRLRRDGILVVAFRDLTRRLYFLQGSPVAYESTARQDAFPNFLFERGVLSEEKANEVLAALGQGMRVGAALADADVPLEGEELLLKLREYLREKASQVVGMRAGRYAFYAGAEFAGEIAPVEVAALAPLLEGARRSFPVKVFAQSLRAHRGEFPHRTAEFGKDLPALGLNNQDLKVAMQLSGRISLEEILAHGRADLGQSYGLLWFLALTGDVAFAKEPLPASEHDAHAVPDRIAPKKRKPLPAETMAKLRDAAVRIITSSYFHVLGLDISADTEAVEHAYHEVAARFHPDSYPDYDTSEIKDLLESVQDKLSASYRVLSVEEKRKAYLRYLLSKLDVGRTAAVNAEAEIALKRGEAALRRKDPRTALSLFEEAVALNPREPEYYCHLAWATYLTSAGPAKDRAKPAQKLLRKALALNPYLERATIISAIIDNEAGDVSSARKRLLKVLEMNPGSQLAKAALRKVGR
ncbi:MAG: response regulator [Myxococcota bacterium]